MNPPIISLLAEKGTAVISVPHTATTEEAIQTMNRERVGCVVVMDGAKLVGVFTERDVLSRVVGRGIALASTPLSEVMTHSPKTVPPDMTVQDALAFISENRCRHLPIVEHGRLIGLVSQGDLTRWLVQAHQAEAEHLRNYIAGGAAS